MLKIVKLVKLLNRGIVKKLIRGKELELGEERERLLKMRGIRVGR
jgi:hypothetical protein